jgi:hypothetical protein
MASKRDQQELPGTRRDDEPPPFKPIPKLEANIDTWQRKLATRKKLNQEINELLVEQQEILVQHDRATYPYEAKGGGERELYRNERVSSRKTKTKAEVEPGKGKRGRKAAAATDEKASAEE